LSEEPNNIELSIIFSVLNEEHTLAPITEQTVIAINNYRFITNWEIIFVDDASTDSSLQVMKDLEAKFPDLVRIMEHKTRQGQKGCFMTGFENARGWMSVVMDADMHVIPEELPLVLDKAIGEGYEMVYTHSDRSRSTDRRTFISSTGNIFMKLIFNSPVRDAANKFTAVETRFIRGVKLGMGDQRYLLPICMRRGLSKVADVPCVFGVRQYGSSNYNKWKKMLIGVPQMISLRIRLLMGEYDLPPVGPGVRPKMHTDQLEEHENAHPFLG